MKIPQKGHFITFEGIEGSGKSTQIKKIANHLNQTNLSHIVTLEPGGTPVGQKLRKIILDPTTNFRSPLTEVMLFYADRLEHVQQVLIPNLTQGKIILCDRYLDSTTAYQIGGRGIDPTLIENLNKTIPLKPDLTILYDIDPQEGLKRAKNRSQLDRFEQETLTFHQKVRQAYLNTAKKEPNRIKIIQVQNQTIDQIHQKTKTPTKKPKP